MKLTRRDAIKAGAGASAAAALGWRTGTAQTSELVSKTIPRTAEVLPVIGLGARNYRVGPSAEERAPYKATLARFAQMGGMVVDSAPSYGNSESVVGDLVAELGIRDQLFIASKVDRTGREEGIEGIESSFEYLRVDTMDLMQVHNLIDLDTQLRTLYAMKDEGRIRYVGVTIWRPEERAPLIEVLERERESLDFIQVDYALNNRGVADGVLPTAMDYGLAVLVNMPLARGSLFAAVGDRPLPDWAADIDCHTWAQVFLKYVVSHPAITCAIPGTTKEHHAVDNLGAAMGRMPDAAMRRMLESYIDDLT